MARVSTACFLVLMLLGCTAAQISYPKMWDLARLRRNRIIKCNVDSSVSLSSTTLHLYRQRPGEALHRLMHFPAGASAATNDPGIPSRFNGKIQGRAVSLTISGIQSDDAATYYCALWKGDTVLNLPGAAAHKPAAASQIQPCALRTTAPSQITSPQTPPYTSTHFHTLLLH